MRAILRPLAQQSTRNPIETIVIYFVLATLSYFHVLSAIKQSTFMSPTVPSVLRPAYALFKAGEWISVDEGKWDAVRDSDSGKVELQQVVFSLDAMFPSKSMKWTKSEVRHFYMIRSYAGAHLTLLLFRHLRTFLLRHLHLTAH